MIVKDQEQRLTGAEQQVQILQNQLKNYGEKQNKSEIENQHKQNIIGRMETRIKDLRDMVGLSLLWFSIKYFLERCPERSHRQFARGIVKNHLQSI